MSYDSWKDNIDHINNVRQKLHKVIDDILDRMLKHDMSKLEYPEKEAYDQLSEQLRTLEYGSQEYKEALAKMRPAINHHYQHNSHHPEHYPSGINGMTLLDLIEMLADWRAAKERHIDRPTSMARSLEINAERFGIDGQLKEILWNTLSYMGWLYDESNPKT